MSREGDIALGGIDNLVCAVLDGGLELERRGKLVSGCEHTKRIHFHAYDGDHLARLIV